MTEPISAADPYPRRRVKTLDTEMAYVDVGAGDPLVFLHGNPTSSYLWRNVIPHVEALGRGLAPDLVGMGDSGRAPAGSYRFVDHARYLDAWFDAIVPARPVTLVVHDWGSALGFDWARRHPERVRGVVYMEALVRPVTWVEWPEPARKIFQAMRSPGGEEIVLERLERRQHDASDADAAVLRLQQRQDAGTVTWHTLEASASHGVVLQQALTLTRPYVNDAADWGTEK